MQRYIDQLIEDMQAAQRPGFPDEGAAPAPPDDEPASGYCGDDDAAHDDASLEAHFAEVEAYLDEANQTHLGGLLMLQPEQFPPPERLSEAQLVQVSEAYERLLNSWRLELELPDNLPAALRYSLLVQTLDRHVFVPANGWATIGFCSYFPEECPMGPDYCQCKDLADDEDAPAFEEGDLPF